MFNFESATFSDLAFASAGLGEHVFAVVASNNGLSMTEDHIDFIASATSNVHKVGVRGGDKPFQLVGISLLFNGRVEEVSVHLLLIILMDNIYPGT